MLWFPGVTSRSWLLHCHEDNNAAVTTPPSNARTGCTAGHTSDSTSMLEGRHRAGEELQGNARNTVTNRKRGWLSASHRLVARSKHAYAFACDRVLTSSLGACVGKTEVTLRCLAVCHVPAGEFCADAYSDVMVALCGDTRT